MSETEYISQSLTTIRKLARRYDMHVWGVAHPTKMQKDADNVLFCVEVCHTCS